MHAEGDGRFTFTRPDGRLIETAPLVVGPEALELLNAKEGLAIDASTPVARWAGELCDYGVAVAGLLALNGIGEPAAAGQNHHSKNGSAEQPPTAERTLRWEEAS